jgi:hypothetical protein
MRCRPILSLIVLLGAGAAARADFLFMQYSMGFRKPQQGQQGGPQPVTPGTPLVPGGPAGSPGADPNADIIVITVNGVAELLDFKILQNPYTARVKATVKTRWGTTNLYNDEQLQTRRVPVPSIKAQYNRKVESLGRNRTNEKLYDLCEWCLNHGLLNEFAFQMDELAKTGKKTNLDKLDRAVEAYTQVKAELAKRIDREDLSTYWRGRLGFRMSQSDHYSLLYNAQLADPPEVERRLKLLEENMRGVYYWFAFRGIPLAMPSQKMVGVLLDQPDQFKVQRALIEDEPLVADSFFSARDNVAVFSAQRLDDASTLFGRQMQGSYAQGWDRAALLKGTAASKIAGKSIDEQYKMQTLALLDTVMEAEGERAAVSHDGTRQLFVNAGLQRQTVIMPDYLQFGMASVFETPKGPFPLAPVEVRVPYWHGWGGPSWIYARIFKQIEQGGMMFDLPTPVRSASDITQASEVLRQVVTDAEFSRARDLGPRAGARNLLIARTYAWGLCYYLAKVRTAGVMKLYDELSKMPRDLELEPSEILACFCRAFDLADVTGTKPDPAKFEAFAKDWLGFMRTVPTPGAEFNLGLEGPDPAAGGGGAPPAGGPAGKGSPKGKG